MAYNSNGSVYYNPVNNNVVPNYTPYMSSYQTPQQTPNNSINQNNQSIVWVQGEADAKARFVSAGNSALFMDSEKPVFYIKTVDMSGMPQPLRVFDFTERTQEEVTATPMDSIPDYLKEDALDKRISALIDKRMGEKKGVKK